MEIVERLFLLFINPYRSVRGGDLKAPSLSSFSIKMPTRYKVRPLPYIRAEIEGAPGGSWFLESPPPL